MKSAAPTPTVADLAQAYRNADAAYQLAYAAFLTGSMKYSDMKTSERAKANAFSRYAKAKKASFRF